MDGQTLRGWSHTFLAESCPCRILMASSVPLSSMISTGSNVVEMFSRSKEKTLIADGEDRICSAFLPTSKFYPVVFICSAWVVP